MKKLCILLTVVMLFGMFTVYADDTSSASVVDSYTWQFGSQGTNGWHYVYSQGGKWLDMAIASNGAYKIPNGGDHPTIESNCLNTGDADVAYKFVSPMKGMIRLRGEIKGTSADHAKGDGTVPYILKGQRELWRGKATWATPAQYDITTSVRKGEEIYFVLNKNINNGYDWSFWTPTVEFLGMEYAESGSAYKHFEKDGDTLTELQYNPDMEGYVASDGKAFISDYELMPSDKTSFVRRYEVKEIGRHRVLAEFFTEDIRGGNTVISVLKNGEKFYEQLVLDDESSVVDARVYAEPGDTIDVEVKAEKFMGYNRMEWTCNVSKYLGTVVADKVVSSQGYSYATDSTTSLSMISGNDRFSNGVDFYVYKYGVKNPMKYNLSQGWRSTIPDDTSYIFASRVAPGSGTTPAFEMTVQKDGIMKLDGKFVVNDASDGVLIKVKQNGNVIWSSREGTEEPQLWNKPYDDSYFNYNINVVTNVKKGDKLEFSFSQWRFPNNDTVDLDGVNIKYIKGDVVSETTKWKLNKSVVIDTVEKTVRMNGATSPVDVFVDGGKSYISTADAARIFGVNTEAKLNINGVDYAPLRASIEKANRAVEWAADRLVIVNDGISVVFGWSELSEIKTALEGGVLFD